MDRKRYCKITFCENFHGTTDKEAHFFLLPISGDYRRQWIQRIMSHQKVDDMNDPKYLICDRHFDQRSIKRSEGRVALRKGTVPTIFPRPIVQLKHDPPANPFEHIDETLSIEYLSNDEPTDTIPTDPIKLEQCHDMATRGFRRIRFIKNTPKRNLDRFELPQNNKEIVIRVHVSNDDDLSSTANGTEHIHNNEEEKRDEKPRPNDCDRCHELAVELAQTSIKLYAAEVKIAREDKKLKQQVKRLRHGEAELRSNKELANAFFENDSNDELTNHDDDESKRAKIAKITRKAIRKGSYLPFSERQLFREKTLSSLNQMSDRSALQAMMDIQLLLKECRDLPAPN